MIYLALIPVAAVVAWCWWPRRPAPSSPFPPVTDTVAGHAQRTRSERLTQHTPGSHLDCPICSRFVPFDWAVDDDGPGPDAA